MTFEEALEFIEAALESKTSRTLSLLEKEILKAAWENTTYNAVADSLYLSIGHIKDLAAVLWQSLSHIIGKKVTKNNFRSLVEKQNSTTAGAFTRSERQFVYQSQESDINELENSPGNILIVDDIPENLHFLTEILTEHGYTVRCVTNGSMALRTVRNHIPDAILLDIKMPDMDGYQVCEVLKNDENFSEIPIIFLSALDQIFDKVKAFKVGGVDYISKPFDPEEVLVRLETHLTIERQKRQLQEAIDRHQQTAEIAYQSRALLANLLNSSLDGIAAVEAVRADIAGEIEDFRCLVVNPVFARLLGKKRTELADEPVLKKLLDRLIPQLFELLVEVVETGESLAGEVHLERDDIGKCCYVTAVKLGDGCSITIRDLTKLKQSPVNSMIEVN
ncbi:response regulator [Tychonema sp. LEGE 07199]|uniref:response regulator n=1 Tax=unclassified Tychonema TaxID=2642144 RepID=UPI00188104D5|nr:MULTISPECIES: response regulator [unclassified Tychonema]MBE9122896.1 response regulator [Tychonema sp. LEGE 07199]MBE9132574.1 response regulator [Tychonema sp. LEGE 07196]